MLPDLKLFVDTLTSCSGEVALKYQDLQIDWTPDEPPPTVLLGALGTALIGSINLLTDTQLDRLSNAIELAMTTNSVVVSTGFLEAVLAAADNNPSAAQFLAKLGPTAKEYCRAWDRFCGTHSPGIW